MYRKLSSFFILLFILQLAFAQEFPYKSVFTPYHDEAFKTELLKLCYPLVAEKQLTYNFTTGDIKNINKTPLIQSLTPKKPASEDSIQVLKKSLVGNFEDAQNTYQIAMQYYALGMQTEFDQTIQKAYEYCDQGIETQPDSSKFYMLKVQILSMYGQQQNVEDVFRLMMKNIPDDKTSYMMLAMSYMQSGRFAEADEMIANGILKFPKDEIFYFNLILNEFFKLAGTSDSEVDNYLLKTPLNNMFNIGKFAEAAKKNKKNFDFVTTYNMTQVFLVFFKAIQQLEDVAKIAEYKPNAEVSEKIAELRLYFEKALKSKKKNNDYMLYYSLGALDVADGNLKNAIVNFDKARADRLLFADAQTSSTEDIYGNLFAVHLLSGDTVSAVKVLETKCSVKPTVSDFNLLAVSYLDLGSPENSEQVLAKAFNTGYYDIKTVRASVVMYLAKNDLVMAEGYLNEIFAASPDDFETLLVAAVFETFRENSDAAYSYLEKAYQFQPENSHLHDIAFLIFESK